MNRASFAGACAVALTLLAGCKPSDSIDVHGSVFDGVSAQASLKLIGTEPFWGLEIAAAASDGSHSARFTQPSDIDGREFSVARFAGNNGLGFSGELAGEVVQVALTPGDCSDGMSDRLYPFVATIAWGDTTLLGCAYSSDAPFVGPAAP